MLTLAVLLLAADPQPTLRWYGQSMFQLTTAAGKRVVFDPHQIPEFGPPRVEADIVLLSHRHSDHTQMTAIVEPKAARVFHGLKEPVGGRPPDWNRVDEKVGAVRVRSVPLYHDPDAGMTRGKNSAWVVEADGLTVCHLGDLGHELTREQAAMIGPVDVLLVPVGGIYTINGDVAKRVVAQLRPKRLVVPMHYGVAGVYDELLPVDEFLDGQPRVRRTPETNAVPIPGEVPAGGYEVVVPGVEVRERPVTWFCCLVRGENFPLELGGDGWLSGFYVTRFVRAADADAAELVAVDALRADPKLTLPPGVTAPDARVYVEEIEPVPTRAVPQTPHGFVWFPMDASG